jgi:hypothetical protein
VRGSSEACTQHTDFLHKVRIGEVLGGTWIGGEFGQHGRVTKHFSDAQCLCSITTLVRLCTTVKPVNKCRGEMHRESKQSLTRTLGSFDFFQSLA